MMAKSALALSDNSFGNDFEEEFCQISSAVRLPKFLIIPDSELHYTV
jgi:hypothetical protein